jgi:hypothetical protein
MMGRRPLSKDAVDFRVEFIICFELEAVPRDGFLL